MCLQCCAEAEFIGDLMPQWALYRGTKDDPEWPLGHWGIVTCNDPDFIFDGELLEDPPDDAPDDVQNKFIDRVIEMEKEFLFRPDIGWSMIANAIKVGYDPANGRFPFWLLDRMAKAYKAFVENGNQAPVDPGMLTGVGTVVRQPFDGDRSQAEAVIQQTQEVLAKLKKDESPSV